MARASLLPPLGVALLALAGALGCASTTTKPLAPQCGRATFAIECMHLGECWQEARRACNGPYTPLAQHENRIPESELPGYTGLTSRNSGERNGFVGNEPGAVPPRGPGFDSDEPLPIAEVVVVCGADG